jgi:hypothetical protein
MGRAEEREGRRRWLHVCLCSGNTVASLEVISDDADALTENIVVDLIIGTSNGNRRGTCSGSNIVAILRSRSNGAG